jgi:hypothetical protein
LLRGLTTTQYRRILAIVRARKKSVWGELHSLRSLERELRSAFEEPGASVEDRLWKVRNAHMAFQAKERDRTHVDAEAIELGEELVSDGSSPNGEANAPSPLPEIESDGDGLASGGGERQASANPDERSGSVEV